VQYLLLVVGGERTVSGHLPALHGHASDVGGGPEGDLGVAVFGDNVAVNALHGDAAVLGDHVAEAGAIEDCAAAEDAVDG
jgi:hypothetical protein